MFSADFSQFLDSLGMFGWRLGLENIRVIMERLGDPQRQFICVHVAGSNGKGSVSHFLEAVFRAAGYRTGLYTSPHLLTPAERVRIAGQTLSDAEFERRMRPLLPVFEQQQATYFEAMTAFALHCFAGGNVEIAIVETGLGGRLDATNIVEPALSIITSISLEHQAWLGETPAAIAAEKAGIIKPGAACVTGKLLPEALAVVEARCREVGVPLFQAEQEIAVDDIHIGPQGSRFRARSRLWPEIEEVAIGLHGRHQVGNAALALVALAKLRDLAPVAAQHVLRGLRDVTIPGRFQHVHELPGLLIDVAHNPESMHAFAETVRLVYPNMTFRVVLGLLRDKDRGAVLQALAPIVRELYCVTPESDRALPAQDLAESARGLGLQIAGQGSFKELWPGVRQTISEQNPVIVTGSHFLVAEVLRDEAGAE